MSDQSNKISASPKVRKFARELGVDINNVKGTERSGRVVDFVCPSFQGLALQGLRVVLYYKYPGGHCFGAGY